MGFWFFLVGLGCGFLYVFVVAFMWCGVPPLFFFFLSCLFSCCLLPFLLLLWWGFLKGSDFPDKREAFMPFSCKT